MLVSVKNTFIEVSFAGEPKGPLRCHSCPPKRSQDKCIMEKDDVDQDQGVNQVELKPKTLGSMAPIPLVLTHDSEAPMTSEEDQCEANDANHTNKRRSRPCKGKRLRHRKFLERLKTEITTKAQSFSIEEIVWPPSYQDNQKRRQNVIRSLQHHQHRVVDVASRSLEHMVWTPF